VTELIATCSRTLYAIRTLEAHGLIGHALHTVFKATVQVRLLYCAPAWSGYCTAADRDRLESFLRRCKRWVTTYCDVDTQSVVGQFQLADETLFKRVLNDDRHVLHSLLLPMTEYSYNLRRRRHDYELIAKTLTLNVNDFIKTCEAGLVLRVTCMHARRKKVKGKSSPIGPGADPGVQTVSPQVTISHSPGGRLP